MAKFIVNKKTGESLEVTPENSAIVEQEYNANPELYELEEDLSQKEEMDANIENERQQQIESEDGLVSGIAKGFLRVTNPNLSEAFESSDDPSVGQRLLASTRDVANVATLTAQAVSKAKMAGGALLNTFADVAGQNLSSGEIDKARTAFVGGISSLPLLGSTLGKGVNKILEPVSDYMKGRAKGQLFSSIVGNKTARLGKNPIRLEDVENEVLAKNVIPVIGTERGAFESMNDQIESELSRKGNLRNVFAKSVEDLIPFAYRKSPEISHFEAVPNPEFAQAQKTAQAKTLGSKGAVKKAWNKWEKDPTLLYGDRPDVRGIKEKTYSVDPAIDEWKIEKIIEKPEQTFRGAISKAKASINSEYKNDKETRNKIIKALDSYVDAQGIPQGGSISAEKASKMVTDLNKIAKTFEKAQGATTANELARSHLASALNNEIEAVSPELREMSKDMRGLMAMKKPVSDRLKSNVVNQSQGFFGTVAGLPGEARAYLNRSPQGAQLKYNVGKLMLEQSPMLQSALDYQRAMASGFYNQKESK